MEVITEMYNEYEAQGAFKVTHIEGDNVFESIRTELQGKSLHTRLTTCEANKHVPTIERGIRELKERIRCSRMIIKFKKIPRRFTLKWLNKSPSGRILEHAHRPCTSTIRSQCPACTPRIQSLDKRDSTSCYNIAFG